MAGSAVLLLQAVLSHNVHVLLSSVLALLADTTKASKGSSSLLRLTLKTVAMLYILWLMCTCEFTSEFLSRCALFAAFFVNEEYIT